MKKIPIKIITFNVNESLIRTNSRVCLSVFVSFYVDASFYEQLVWEKRPLILVRGFFVSKIHLNLFSIDKNAILKDLEHLK